MSRILSGVSLYKRAKWALVLRRLFIITNWPSVCQGTYIFWHSLAYAGIRWCSLAHRFKFVEVRSRTLLFAQYVETFLCMHRMFRGMPTNSPYAAGSFDERNSTVCSPTVRQRIVPSAVAFVQPNCGHFFPRISNVLIRFFPGKYCIVVNYVVLEAIKIKFKPTASFNFLRTNWPRLK